MWMTLTTINSIISATQLVHPKYRHDVINTSENEVMTTVSTLQASCPNTTKSNVNSVFFPNMKHHHHQHHPHHHHHRESRHLSLASDDHRQHQHDRRRGNKLTLNSNSLDFNPKAETHYRSWTLQPKPQTLKRKSELLYSPNPTLNYCKFYSPNPLPEPQTAQIPNSPKPHSPTVLEPYTPNPVSRRPKA